MKILALAEIRMDVPDDWQPSRHAGDFKKYPSQMGLNLSAEMQYALERHHFTRSAAVDVISVHRFTDSPGSIDEDCLS